MLRPGPSKSSTKVSLTGLAVSGLYFAAAVIFFRSSEYYFLILCSTLGMMIMASGIDLITSFIGLETMAVSFYILVGFIKPSQRSNEAAVERQGSSRGA